MSRTLQVGEDVWVYELNDPPPSYGAATYGGRGSATSSAEEGAPVAERVVDMCGEAEDTEETEAGAERTVRLEARHYRDGFYTTETFAFPLYFALPKRMVVVLPTSASVPVIKSLAGARRLLQTNTRSCRVVPSLG